MPNLVASHFAILKVGPELTFAYREAVVAMAHMEEWLPCQTRSNVLHVIRNTMDNDPRHWLDYVAADDRSEVSRMFGLSDRVRYYWTHPELRDAVQTLRTNIDGLAVDLGLVAQYVGDMDLFGRTPGLTNSEAIIQAKVGAVVRKYRGA